MDQVVKRAIITEKSMLDAGRGKFTFEVAHFATKPLIKRAIETQFSVNVVKVQTATMPEKKRKKAVVTLKAGQRIPLFKVGEKKEG